MLIYMYMHLIYAMKILGIDFDKATVANSVALILMVVYAFFIYMGTTIPADFHDLIKIVAAFLFVSKAYETGYENGNNALPPS